MAVVPPPDTGHEPRPVRRRPNPAELPRFLNLFSIRFPIGAIASIGHRISGICLLFVLLLVPGLLARSLRSEEDYSALLAAWRSAWAAPLELLLVWAFSFHVMAGVRHLLMDVGIGSELRTARASARAVLVVAFLVSLIILAIRRLS